MEHELLANEMSYSVEQGTTDLRSWNGQSIRTDIGSQQVNVELHDVREINTDYPRNQLWGENMTEKYTSELLMARISVIAQNCELAGAYRALGREGGDDLKQAATRQQVALVEWLDGLNGEESQALNITNTFNQPLDIEDVKQAVAEVFAEHELQLDIETEVTIEDDEEEGGEPERRGTVIEKSDLRVGDVIDTYGDYDYTRLRRWHVVDTKLSDYPGVAETPGESARYVLASGWGEIRLVERPEPAEPEPASNGRRGVRITNIDQVNDGDLVDLYYGAPSETNEPSEEGEPIVFQGSSVRIGEYTFLKSEIYDSVRHAYLVEKAKPERRGTRITLNSDVSDGDIVDCYWERESREVTRPVLGHEVKNKDLDGFGAGGLHWDVESYDQEVRLVEKAKANVLTDQDDLPEYSGSKIRVLKFNRYGEDEVVDQVREHDGDTADQWRSDEGETPLYLDGSQVLEFEVLYDASDDLDFNY